MKRVRLARSSAAAAAGSAAILLLATCTGAPAGAPLISPQSIGTPTATPFLPSPPSPTPAVTTLWLSPAVPGALREKVREASAALARTVELVSEPEDAALHFLPGGNTAVAQWTYAVAEPFPTVRDSITLTELRFLWKVKDDSGLPIFASGETLEVMRAVLGEPGTNVRPVDDPGTMVDSAWAVGPSLAILPFEDLENRWKVLELDGQSPVRRDFDPSAYPLLVPFGVQSGVELPEDLQRALEAEYGNPLPIVNRRPDRLTTVVMTGVTALTRATAWQMDRSGVTFPSRDIGDWLRQADITHVSNEVSFTPDCPDPLPDLTVLLFCASPRYLGLLQDVGVDVVELTGNHLLDVGPQPMLYSLDLYRQSGLSWFGGGTTLAEAEQPLRMEHNGNRIAFLGCNEAGPAGVWAKEDRPGANPCGADRLQSQARALRAEGYLPIATFQWYEHYTPSAPASQREVFGAAATAGAVAVSGSQAHQPQGFAFQDGAFIHYGLGNLFFDQMWSEDVRKEFVDRYVFYDGRLVSVELLTAYLEDWARPRPMTPEERASFLEGIFRASGW
jgi:poly-gamma-glutamate synthesis protein (capsule biosynthesis protein)